MSNVGRSISEDLSLAAQVHYSFLPEDLDDARLNIAVTMRPLHTLGGDYCSILQLDDDKILVCMCDAVGHDISSALFAARINTYVLTHARNDLIPCDLVAGLNAYLCKRLAGTGMYASFYALLLDFSSAKMALSGAAHPPVLQLEKGQDRCLEWSSTSTFLGIADPMPVMCGSDDVQLNSGDRFLLYSDGLIEAENARARAFGMDGLASAFIKYGDLAGQDLNRSIIREAELFADDGFGDDVLLISISIN